MKRQTKRYALSSFRSEPNKPSRRQFLSQSGKLVAGSVLTGVALSRIHAAEDNTIRLALVGCGGRGTGAVGNAFSTTGGPVKLYAMADLFEERLQRSLSNITKKFSDKVDAPPERQFVGFDGYKKAIDCLRPGDVVLLTTHAAFRPLQFEYAVNKGVNVFAEKSFATDSPAVRRWLKAAEVSEKKNLKVGVGFMWRHSEARQEVIRRIHDGAIGDVHTLRIYRVHGPVHCPRREENVSELVFQLQHPNSFNWSRPDFSLTGTATTSTWPAGRKVPGRSQPRVWEAAATSSQVTSSTITRWNTLLRTARSFSLFRVT